MIRYLKFTDEETAKEILSEFVDDSNQWMIASQTHSLDPIGPLVIDDEGTVDPAFHVNIQGAVAADLTDYIVTPTSPRRVWA